MYRRLSIAMASVLIIVLFAAGAVMGQRNIQQTNPTPTPAPEQESEAEAAGAMTEEAEEEDLQLVTAKVSADLVRPGRVLMSARGNHWIYDSVPPLNGPNEEVNPLDGILAALGACGMYIYEAVGREQHIPVNHLSSTVTGELDGRGAVAGAAVSPRVRAFHVTMNLEGPNAEQAAMMAEAFIQRCPIHTTLARSAPIHITNVVMGVAQEAISTEADPIVDDDPMDEPELQLGKPSASGVMFGFGRSVMSARGNHWIFDSVPPIHGPNEEVNPLDALVGALPACGIMIYEAAAKENDIALNSLRADVEADLDPRGVAGVNVNPRVRAFRVTMHVDGPSAEEAEMLAGEFSRRCPIYTTFERSAPIEVTTRLAGEGTAVLDVTFTYDFDSADEYIAEVSPMAEMFAAVPGLVWKTWTLNPETKRAGAVYLFENPEIRQAYMDGELFGAVKSHPALSDHRIRTYDVMRSESLVTHAQLRGDGEGMADASTESGMILDVEFTYDFDTADEYIAEVSPLAEQFAAVPGLLWKVWTLNPEMKTAGAAYYFADAEALQTYMDGELFGAVKSHPALSGHEISTFQVMGPESAITRAPIEIVNRVKGAGQATVEVIASGLDNPRGITIGPDGALYVVEAGRGDDDDVDGDEDCGVESPIGPACVGLTGAVTRIADGTQERILTELSSFATPDGAAAFGPHDIAFQDAENAYVTVGFCIFENESCGRLIHFDPATTDEWQTVADIQTFEVDNNPDAANPGESNPYGLLLMADRTIVADAAGNTLLEITPDGEISVLNIFPKRDEMDSVPTAVVEGPDGALYVAELTGFPYPAGGAHIYRIEPGAEPEVYAEGFTNIIDIAFADDGSLFVLEIATNSLASGDPTGGLHRLDPNGQRELALGEGLISPTALAIDTDGVIYISNQGQSAGVGEVLRVQLDTP